MVSLDIGTMIGIVIGILGLVAAIVAAVDSRRQAQKYQAEFQKSRTITWDELRQGSNSLRKEIEKNFRPTAIFTPCRRGASIANLMYDNQENILLYVGIRIDKRLPGAAQMATPPTNDWRVADTGKYYHYIPNSLVNLLVKEKTARLLILDDYTQTGDSLARITNFLKENGAEPSNLKTAAMVCHDSAIQGNKAPDFYWRNTDKSDFLFPWGKAV